MRHIAHVTKAKTMDQEEIMAVLDRVFAFALQVIQAKGKGTVPAT